MVAGLGLEPRNPEGEDLQSSAIATMRTRHVKLSLLPNVLFPDLQSAAIATMRTRHAKLSLLPIVLFLDLQSAAIAAPGPPGLPYGAALRVSLTSLASRPLGVPLCEPAIHYL